MHGKSNLMLDFHHYSVDQARAALESYLQLSLDMGVEQLRIVTGHGNHVNARGERGTLFHDLPVYLEQSIYKNRVLRCEGRKGHYVLYLKTRGASAKYEAEARGRREAYFMAQLEKIKAEAAKDNPTFLTLYAELIEKGECGLAQDFPLVANLYLRAANLGFAPAMHEYGRCCLHGVGVKQSDPLAVEWVEKSHLAGNIGSTVSLARWKYEGLKNYPADKAEGLRLYHQAIDGGSTDAMRFIATLYREQKRFIDSFHLYKKAADLGDPVAQFNTAIAYARGLGVAKDIKEEVRYLDLASRGGDPDAECQLGAKLYFGSKAPDLKEYGLELLINAADQGSSQACHLLGMSRDSKEDTRYLERSVRLGNIVDQLRINALKTGRNEPLNIDIFRYEDVIPIFKRLEDNALILLEPESKFVIFDLVLMQGDADNKRKAFRLIDSMAEEGCPLSIRRKIYFYQRGDGLLGVKKDSKIVIELLKLCIKCDDAIALVMQAKLHLIGQGCIKSPEVALQLLQLAAKKHYPPAFYYMGLLYEKKLIPNSSQEKAFQSYSLALKLEAEPGRVAKFKFGPIDGYEMISGLANEGVARTAPMDKVESPPVRRKSPIEQPQFPQAPMREEGPLQDTPDGERVDKTISQNVASQKATAPSLVRDIEELQNSNATNQYSFFSGRNVAFAVGAIATMAVAFMAAK
jgi:TPR repeat protein